MILKTKQKETKLHLQQASSRKYYAKIYILYISYASMVYLLGISLRKRDKEQK